jgi:hypothetical protein
MHKGGQNVRCRLLIMLMMAVVISNGFLAPSAQAEKSAEFDFWIEKVDPATGKGEKALYYTLDDLENRIIVIKNSGTEHISTADVKYKCNWQGYSLSHFPHFATRFIPISLEGERKWEVNLKPGEEKRIEEIKSAVEWTKFEISLLGYTLTGYNVDNGAVVVDGKFGPIPIKGIKADLAHCKETVTVKLFIDGKSLGEKSCEWRVMAKAH